MTAAFARMLGATVSAARRSVSNVWKLEARFKGVALGQNVNFAGRPLLTVARDSSLILGNGVTVVSSFRATPLGCFQPCVLRTLAPGAVLRLGSGVGISGAVICAGLEVSIGEGTLIGSGAMIIDNDFHALGPDGWRTETRENAKPIRLGREVFVGARAIILKGVTIGDRAVIGAGAVVTKNVPAGCVAAGNPACIFPAKSPATFGVGDSAQPTVS